MPLFKAPLPSLKGSKVAAASSKTKFAPLTPLEKLPAPCITTAGAAASRNEVVRPQCALSLLVDTARLQQLDGRLFRREAGRDTKGKLFVGIEAGG